MLYVNNYKRRGVICSLLLSVLVVSMIDMPFQYNSFISRLPIFLFGIFIYYEMSCSLESQHFTKYAYITSILQLVVGPDHDKAVLARLNDGYFAIVTVGTPAARMARAVHEAMNASRREFNISLSRRGSFTVAIASAEWGETASWDMTLSLAQQRL